MHDHDRHCAQFGVIMIESILVQTLRLNKLGTNKHNP